MEYDQNSQKITQSTETSEDCQHPNIADDNLFFDLLNKCHCWFTKFESIEDLKHIEPWHCHAFHSMTGVKMNIDNCVQICLDCVDILEIFSELRRELGGMQKRYIEFSQVTDENGLAGVQETQLKTPSKSDDDESQYNRMLIDGEEFEMYEALDEVGDDDETETTKVSYDKFLLVEEFSNLFGPFFIYQF